MWSLVHATYERGEAWHIHRSSPRNRDFSRRHTRPGLGPAEPGDRVLRRFADAFASNAFASPCSRLLRKKLGLWADLPHCPPTDFVWAVATAPVRFASRL